LARGNEASARMLEADQASGTAAEMQRMADQRAASEAAKSGTFNSAVDAVRDTGVNLARGVADIGQAATGLVAMPLDAVGALEPLKKVGVDFRGASKGLDDFDKWAAGYLSDTGKDKEAKLEAAKGFTDTLMTLGTDPRLMYQEIIKSLPGTFGAGKVGEAAVGVYGSRFAAEAKAAGLTGEVAQRYIAKAFADNADKITKAAMIGSAAGEGTQQAGGLAGKAQKDSIAFKDYAGPAVASGVLDAAISLGSSKLANKIGIGDIETDIALRKTGVSSGKTAPAFWLNRGAIEGFKEGAFEELPQSTQEAIAENLAYGRPWDQGLGKAAAQGLATGFGMGGGHAIVSHQSDNQSSGAEPIQPAAPADTAPVNAADVLGTAPDATTSFSDTEIQSITDNASRRIAAIERKAKGTPDQNMPGPDGKPMVVHGEPAQFLTDNEKAELDFLKKNMGNPQAIADAYGIKPASAKPAETPAQALAPSAASLTEGPRPDVPMIKGKVDTVKTDSGVPLRYQWALVPIDEEIRSHTSSLNVNPVYPAEFQPRDRTRTASATQASEMQQRYDPTRAGWSPDIQNGAPIISPDGVMLSGNMRGLVQDRILSAGGDKAEELRNHIAETAEQYGFTPEQVKQAFAENPRMALRRVLVDPINRSEFARQANASTVAQMSPSEQASTDAARITHMDDLNPTEAGDFAASRDFVKRFVGALPITEQAGMMDKDGQLSQAGYARIRNAILAKAYGNSPALLRMTESMDDSLRNISKALMQVAPAVAKSRDGIAQGALHPVEITDVLLPAVESLNRLRESGVSVAEHVAQQGMFGNARPEVADMLRFLDENIRRPRKVADFLNAYLAALDAAGNPGQGTLLGGSTVPTQADLMAAARRSTNDEQFAATAEAPRLSRSERRGGSPGADTESQSQSGDTQGNRRGAGEGAQPAVDLSTSQGEHHGKEGQGEGRRQEGLLNASGGEVSPGLAKEESAVYAVNEPDKFTGDLFNHEIPEADGDNMDRARKAATGSPDSQAAAVTAVRGDPENPGVFTVTTNLVTVGERKLPLNRVRTVEDAATVFAYLAKSAVEHYDALVTDKNGKPLAIIGSFKGELTSASVYPGVVAQELARIDGAATLWGAHNHPSGIAELSRADEVLSDTFAKLMRGSGVEYAGLFAMSGTASGKTQYSFYTQGGTTETGATDNTLPAKYNVPIVERELIDSGARLGSVNTPNQAKALVAEIAKDSPGILFMDAQHRAVSFVPFEPKAMGRLRTDGRLMKLFESVSKNNAGAAVIAMPDGKVTRKQFLNLQGALKSMEIRVLDGVEYDSASKVPGLSMAERGLDAGGPGIAFFSRTKTSASPDESLIIQHNLSADKLLHAFRMGGLPVPSLAITDKYMPIEGFGDITLLGSRNMADPKGYASTKAFGADIYSPRYPTVKYVTTPAMRKRAEAILKDGLEATNSRVAWDEIKDKGASELSYTAALRWKFLKERGIEPAIVRAEAKPLPKELQPFAKTDSNPFELEQDLAFIDAVYAVHERELVRAYGGDVRAAKDEIAQSRANADKRGVSYLVRESARQVNQYRMDAAANGAIDRVATNLAMEKQIYDAGLRDDLERYAAEFLRDINPDEKIFKGFTYSGNPRYAPHTLDNVVKELRKELRGGEGFNYGVGSVRSAFTPQFRTIDQIRKAKDRLLGKAEFEKVKSEIDSEFSAVSDTLAPYHSHSNEFGFGEIVSSMMYDSAKMGVPRALKENAFDDVPVEAQQNVVRFLNKLRTLPTQYFEAKILRAVDFGEFAGAVVPEGVDPKVIDALTSRGVTDIRTYKNGDEGSRAKAVTALAEELHQAGKGTLFSRGTALDGGISTENVEREAKKLLAGLSNPPKLSVAWSPKDLPFDAPSDTRGVFFKGTMYLVAGGITSAENLREVVAHEMIGHYGMRGFFGAALDAVLSRIHNINPLVQKNAKAWIENNQDLIAEYRKEGMTEAQIKSISIEEGMAKIAEAGKVLTGARLLTVALQRLLRAVGLRNMANTLESNTDAEALLALKKAEMFAKRSWTKDNYIREAIYPAFMREQKLANDLPAQEKWLDTEARARGFKSIDDLAEKAYPVFEKLATLWRKQHPVETALMVRRVGGLRVVDMFGNGSRVQHFDDRRGLFYEAQKYPSGLVGWRAGEVIDGIEHWLSTKEFGSMDEAQAAVRGLRISNTARQKSAEKYGAIPALWTGEAKRVAKAIIDAGIGVERFSASTQSKSKYVYLDSGVKVRLADHALPGSYDQPDVDYRYGGDIKALIAEVKAAEEGAPTPDSGELGSRSLGETKMQERPVRADKSGLAEPAQSGSGAGSNANVPYFSRSASPAPVVRNSQTANERAAPVFSRSSPAVSPTTPPAARPTLKARADQLISRMDSAVNGLGKLPDQAQYLADRYLALGKIAHIDEIAWNIRKVFSGATPADKKAVYAYLTTRGATAAGVQNATVRATAESTKKYIGTVGDQLVARGLIPETSREEYRDRYLPRLYLAHLLDDASWRAIGGGKKASDMGYLKQRNEDLPEEYRKVILGEVTDPAFLAASAIAQPMRDMAILDWLQKISGNQQWVWPKQLIQWGGRTVSAHWLQAEADALLKRSALYENPADKKKAESIATDMRKKALAAMAEMPREHEDYKRIPDTPRYGLLRGLMVRREIHDDLVGLGSGVPGDASWARRYRHQGPAVVEDGEGRLESSGADPQLRFQCCHAATVGRAAVQVAWPVYPGDARNQRQRKVLAGGEEVRANGIHVHGAGTAPLEARSAGA